MLLLYLRANVWENFYERHPHAPYTSAFIVMGGIFLSFPLDKLGQRYVQWRTAGKEQTERVSPATYSTERLNVLTLKGGSHSTLSIKRIIEIHQHLQ
jgi:hypothetical protein